MTGDVVTVREGPEIEETGREICWFIPFLPCPPILQKSADSEPINRDLSPYSTEQSNGRTKNGFQDIWAQNLYSPLLLLLST